MSGEAFTLRLKLAKLMQRHGMAPPASFSVPLFDPVDGPLTLAGLASTSDIDFGRQKFRPYCFDNLCLTLKGYPFPKLYMKHDESKVVGEITSLKFDDRGRLRIVADVTDDRAKCFGAFSVGVKVSSFEIVNPDSKDFHGLITRAEITEVSLTDVPANQYALVQSRYATPPFALYAKARGEQDDLFSRAFTLLQKQLEAIGTLANVSHARHSAQADVANSRHSPPARARPPSPTQFRSLVDQLSMRST